MIYEYALEPEMVAAWCDRHNHRFFIREFGLGQGRVVSRYPKTWAKKVWDSFDGTSQVDRKRLEELLVRLKETMVKRRDYVWDDALESWLENALQEHARHPFYTIMARTNPEEQQDILTETDLAGEDIAKWDVHHGITVNRKAPDMAAAIKMMLGRCRWVKFIDPYLSQCKSGHKRSLTAFMDILKAEKPVGPPGKIEIHTNGDGATIDYLKNFYEKIIPDGIQVTIYQWREKPAGQRLHNRYILTDLGGVSFHHGLDTGADGETDDITRLDREQYELRCKQYDSAAPAFDYAEDPLEISGTFGE
ncbi:MAG TPA: hypothetical protein ENG91_04915 [Desulfobacteraceae bacterium]|nr:hypothetical protein BMS3Abin13_00357 [bacterium BMS3Abin13]HDK43876.1 hypothetical protein [Desulfobacteraceae bacterium]